MIIGIPSLFTSNTIEVEEFTLNDFRNISFLIENHNDLQLQKFLFSKIKTPCNCFDKVYALFQSRIKFINENIVLNNGVANITINLAIWDEVFKKNVENVKTELIYDEFKVIVDYPQTLLFDTFEDIIIDSIYNITFKNNTLNFLDLSKEDKIKILEHLPVNLIHNIKNYIEENMFYSICLMEEKLGLPEISINLLDESMYSFLKSLYNYYTADDIIETIFFLSKRISDIAYLNSRTPREVEILIDLYSDEFEKGNQDTKLNI